MKLINCLWFCYQIKEVFENDPGTHTESKNKYIEKTMLPLRMRTRMTRPGHIGALGSICEDPGTDNPTFSRMETCVKLYCSLICVLTVDNYLR